MVVPVPKAPPQQTGSDPGTSCKKEIKPMPKEKLPVTRGWGSPVHGGKMAGPKLIVPPAEKQF